MSLGAIHPPRHFHDAICPRHSLRRGRGADGGWPTCGTEPDEPPPNERWRPGSARRRASPVLPGRARHVRGRRGRPGPRDAVPAAGLRGYAGDPSRKGRDVWTDREGDRQAERAAGRGPSSEPEPDGNRDPVSSRRRLGRTRRVRERSALEEGPPPSGRGAPLDVPTSVLGWRTTGKLCATPGRNPRSRRPDPRDRRSLERVPPKFRSPDARPG